MKTLPVKLLTHIVSGVNFQAVDSARLSGAIGSSYGLGKLVIKGGARCGLEKFPSINQM